MESFFGPPSEQVDIGAFLKSTENLFEDPKVGFYSSEWLSLTQDQRNTIEGDCRCCIIPFYADMQHIMV